MPAPAYNPGIHRVLVDAEKRGLSRRSVAAMAGISARTYWKWLSYGKAAAEAREDGGECPAEWAQYADLFLETEKARAEWEAQKLQELNDEEKVNAWTKQAWQLERRMPDEYSLTTTVRHEGEIEHKTVVELPEETQRKMLEAFAEMTKPKELERGDG